ncbi:hypothetical protein M404DRAFT_1006095 [Pisolithus tinctorius Marx 270]|uniref:Uncharacterized protein n=1 Tax=Pisolithus tinctorius Marx 270 TaxID=870435 RepID=A0A0C3NQ70_PISTI|nr:hypothetical protein M404DRAFT_1006095 [Pisolithus tinctorius Marx 270]
MTVKKIKSSLSCLRGVRHVLPRLQGPSTSLSYSQVGQTLTARFLAINLLGRIIHLRSTSLLPCVQSLHRYPTVKGTRK